MSQKLNSEHPVFSMSKYVKSEDLYKDKAEYYEKEYIKCLVLLNKIEANVDRYSQEGVYIKTLIRESFED